MIRRIHIVGAGGYARVLTDQANLMADEGLCRRGVVVVDPRFLPTDEYSQTVEDRRREGWSTVESFDALVGGDVAGDLVVLPVPINLHAEMSCRLLAAGADVLCEKPAAGSRSEVERMATAARRTGGILRFGFQHILSPSMVRLQREVAGGTIGEIISIAGRVLWPRPESYFARARWAGALRVDGVPVLDSPIQNAGAHFLHAMLEFADTLGHTARSVTAEHARINEIETADMQALRVTTTGPEIRYLASHSTVHHIDPEIVVSGSRGNLRWQFPDRLILERSGRIAAHAPPRILVDGPGGHALNALALRTALIHPATGTDVESAQRHLAVVHAAFGGENALDFPIPPLPGNYWEVVETDSGPIRGIIGFRATAEELFLSGRLPSEISVPWSAAVYRVEDAPLSARGDFPK
jgi:predicted dehydrogenase